MDWFDLPEDLEEEVKQVAAKESCPIGEKKCPICNNVMKPGACVCDSCGTSTS